MIAVALTVEVERRLAELAEGRGKSNADFARELIEASIEDIDDVEMAASRLRSRQPTLTSSQARKALGLDD